MVQPPNCAPKDSAAIMSDHHDETPAQLPKHKVKYKMALQRACNEKDEKGKFCGGHLKRWFYMADAIEQAFAPKRDGKEHSDFHRAHPIDALRKR